MSSIKHRYFNITPEYVRERLDYDPDTGILRWRDHPDLLRKDKIGCQAGGSNGRYLQAWIGGRLYHVQHLAWAHFYVQWPKEILDHEDTDGFNNRIGNLREGGQSQNRTNSKRGKNNTSGFKGVTRDKGKWVARIGVNGKLKYLGAFDLVEDAARAYRDAAYAYHQDFARVE